MQMCYLTNSQLLIHLKVKNSKSASNRYVKDLSGTIIDEMDISPIFHW